MKKFIFSNTSAKTPSPAKPWIALSRFHFPLQAKLSITHRITGIITILFLLAGLGILNFWLLKPKFFNEIVQFWQSFYGKALLWLGLSALLFHWLAGIRHLLMEHNILYMQTTNNSTSGKILLWLYLILWLLLTGEIWR